MKMENRNRLSIILVLVIVVLMTMLPVSAYAAKGGSGGPTKPPSGSTTISYVALGDSIATGTVTNWSNIPSYVTYFHQYLQSIYGRKTTVKLQNLAHDGDKTNELLTKLQNDPTFKTAVTGANVITISIGGNNLMQAAQIPGFTNVDWNKADQGVVDFQAQWSEIITEITKLNGSAKIIAMTVYNPYNINPPAGYYNDIGLHEAVDVRLKLINASINDNTGLRYKVADVFSAFDAYSQSSMGNITYLYPSTFSYLFRNPHPNSNGQSIITNLHKTVYSSFN